MHQLTLLQSIQPCTHILHQEHFQILPKDITNNRVVEISHRIHSDKSSRSRRISIVVHRCQSDELRRLRYCVLGGETEAGDTVFGHGIVVEMEKALVLVSNSDVVVHAEEAASRAVGILEIKVSIVFCCKLVGVADIDNGDVGEPITPTGRVSAAGVASAFSISCIAE